MSVCIHFKRTSNAEKRHFVTTHSINAQQTNVFFLARHSFQERQTGKRAKEWAQWTIKIIAGYYKTNSYIYKIRFKVRVRVGGKIYRNWNYTPSYWYTRALSRARFHFPLCLLCPTLSFFFFLICFFLPWAKERDTERECLFVLNLRIYMRVYIYVCHVA